MNATIYHNPRCSTSREALRLLKAVGAEATVIEYLKMPPTVAELKRLDARAGMMARRGLRAAEPDAKHLARAGDAAILEAMVVNRILIERPLVETDRGVVLAPARAGAGHPVALPCRPSRQRSTSLPVF